MFICTMPFSLPIFFYSCLNFDNQRIFQIIDEIKGRVELPQERLWHHPSSLKFIYPTLRQNTKNLVLGFGAVFCNIDQPIKSPARLGVVVEIVFQGIADTINVQRFFLRDE